MACLCLHNYLCLTENSLYTPEGFFDVELAYVKLGKPPKFGQRKIVPNELWKNLKHFVNSEIRSILWQLDYVRSVGETRGDK